METRAFAPLYSPSVGQTQGGLLACVTVGASVAAAASTVFPGGQASGKVQIQVTNKTTAWAHVNFGNLNLGVVTPATVASSYPVAPGASVIISVAGEVNAASVILDAASTGGTTVIFCRGEGL